MEDEVNTRTFRTEIVKAALGDGTLMRIQGMLLGGEERVAY